MSEKKWVFNLLVKSPNDSIGLLAYALYKYRKADLAENLRKSGKTDKEIATQLSSFHENTVNSESTLEDFRVKAKELVFQMGDAAGNAMYKDTLQKLEVREQELKKLEQEFTKEKTKFDETLKKAKTKQRNELIDQLKAAVQNTPPKSKSTRFKDWIVGGAAGIAAQVLLLVITLGCLTIVSGGSDALIKKFVDKTVSTLISTPNVVTLDPKNNAMTASKNAHVGTQ
ncbi:hypothetical protein [Vibrio crassostreae]|uniref:hypothetical protein n=1 Tax=Vibrio crassostreae TaxID=246167 RepID=UPI001B30DEC2|nr:hypothetical protein [Vibrio crassostreae]